MPYDKQEIERLYAELSSPGLLDVTDGPGKFEGTIHLAKLLYNLSMGGAQDSIIAAAEAGSVQENGVWGAFFPDLSAFDETRGKVGPMVAAILWEDDQGFVSCDVYETLVEADAEWEEFCVSLIRKLHQ